MTGSRKTLRDLTRDPETEASEFFNIFDPTPVRVGPFDEMDLAAVMAGVPEVTLAGGAKTEFMNATNGFPILLLESMNVVLSKCGKGEVSQPSALEACDASFVALDGYRPVGRVPPNKQGSLPARR